MMRNSLTLLCVMLPTLTLCLTCSLTLRYRLALDRAPALSADWPSLLPTVVSLRPVRGKVNGLLVMCDSAMFTKWLLSLVTTVWAAGLRQRSMKRWDTRTDIGALVVVSYRFYAWLNLWMTLLRLP